MIAYFYILRKFFSNIGTLLNNYHILMSLLIPSVTDTRISKFTLSSLLYMVCDVDTVIYITHAY